MNPFVKFLSLLFVSHLVRSEVFFEERFKDGEILVKLSPYYAGAGAP